MKLQEFFNAQKDISFTDVDKLDLYQHILYKKNRKPSLKRTSFVHAKYFITTSIIAVMILGIYGVYFIKNDNFQDFNRFAITSPTTNTVQADYIAQVIEVKGNFFIEHNGVLDTTNNIGNGDTILLKKDAQLVFEINSGTQSKIIGPAKLVIQKTDSENYKLNLIYGDFIQMEGNQEKDQNIELAINDITIKQKDVHQPINFKFIKRGESQIFQNNGGNMIVTQNNGKEKSTTITTKQVVAIQTNDIKIFANMDTFTEAVQEKNISQTFNVSTAIESGSEKEQTQTLLSLLNTQEIVDPKTEITEDISSALGVEKQILNPEEDDQVNASLYQNSYTPELKEINERYVAGDEEGFTAAFAKIEKRIQTVSKSFGVTYERAWGEPSARLEEVNSSIKKLIAIMDEKYTVPPKYVDNLQNISKSLMNTLHQGRGSSATVEETK